MNQSTSWPGAQVKHWTQSNFPLFRENKIDHFWTWFWRCVQCLFVLELSSNVQIDGPSTKVYFPLTLRDGLRMRSLLLQLIVSPQSGTSTQTDFSLWSCDKPSGCSITVLDADNCNGGLPQPLHLNFTWPPAAGTFEITFTQPYFLAGCTYLVCAFLWITSVLILYSDMKQFLIKSRRYLSRWKIQRPVKLVFILKSTWNYSILTCWSPRLSRSGFPCRCLNSDKFLDFQHSTAELDGLLFAVDQPSLYQHRISQVLAWYIMWLG